MKKGVRAMRNALAVVVSGFAVLAAASAIVAAPVQDRPGQPTQAKVWVENRGPFERIPVSLQEVSTDMTLRVQVVGTPSMQIVGTPAVTLAAGTVVQTRTAANQQWEYQTILVGSAADPAAALRQAGSQGWETTGLQFPAAGGALVLLKKPR
jgi:hypothetical protein